MPEGDPRPTDVVVAPLRDLAQGHTTSIEPPGDGEFANGSRWCESAICSDIQSHFLVYAGSGASDPADSETGRYMLPQLAVKPTLRQVLLASCTACCPLNSKAAKLV